MNPFSCEEKERPRSIEIKTLLPPTLKEEARPVAENLTTLSHSGRKKLVPPAAPTWVVATIWYYQTAIERVR